MHTFILLLASNCEASYHMSEAMERIRQQFPDEIRFSGVHESEAFGSTPVTAPRPSSSSVSTSTDSTSTVSPSTDPPSTTYLNAVCSGRTTLSREKMERWLKDTETNMGRIRGELAHGRVHIDLDLVIWDETILRPLDAGRSYYQTCLNDFV